MKEIIVRNKNLENLLGYIITLRKQGKQLEVDIYETDGKRMLGKVIQSDHEEYKVDDIVEVKEQFN